MRSGAAVDLKTRFDKDGITVLQGHDGDFTVRFDLRAFDSGALHVSSLVASPRAGERARVSRHRIFFHATPPVGGRYLFFFIIFFRIVSRATLALYTTPNLGDQRVTFQRAT